jgi:hypothetical protein
MSPMVGSVGTHVLGVKLGAKPEGTGFHGKIVVPPGEHFTCPHIHLFREEAVACGRERLELYARDRRIRVIYEEVAGML